MFLHSIHRKPHDLLENTGILQLQYSGREFFFFNAFSLLLPMVFFFAGYCPWSLIFLRTNGTILNTIMKKCHSNWCSSLDFENAWSFFFSERMTRIVPGNSCSTNLPSSPTMENWKSPSRFCGVWGWVWRKAMGGARTGVGDGLRWSENQVLD